MTLTSRGRGARAFYLVLSDDEELVALKKVVVGGATCEASLAVEAPDEACEWRLVLRAVFEGARGFDAAVELPAITVVGKALDAGAAGSRPRLLVCVSGPRLSLASPKREYARVAAVRYPADAGSPRGRPNAKQGLKLGRRTLAEEPLPPQRGQPLGERRVGTRG